MANRVNLRAVELAQDRRQRAAAAGITYDEQLAIDQKSGREVGGQRGLAQALGPDGQSAPAGWSAGWCRRACSRGTHTAPTQTPAAGSHATSRSGTDR